MERVRGKKAKIVSNIKPALKATEIGLQDAILGNTVYKQKHKREVKKAMDWLDKVAEEQYKEYGA